MKKATERYIQIKIKKWLHNAKVFFRSERSKEVITFLLFWGLSFLFWVLQSLNEEVEASFKIPIRFTNVPDKVMITNEYPQYLDIRIRDNGTTMMNYMIDRFVPVEIDFNQYQNKRGQFTISLAKLSALVRKQLKNTTGLVFISPVEEITMKKMTLAVKIENIPDNMTMLLFPATVEVSYMLPISHFAKVTAGDIEIGVDYRQIKNNSGNKLAVKVLKQPSFVKHLQVMPDSIEYILEEKVL